MTQIFIEKLDDCFIPSGIASAETFEGLQRGDYLAKLSRPRNIAYHRQYFALLNELVKHQDEFANVEELRAAIAVAIGECKVIEVRGRTVAIPKSIAFSSMDQLAFKDFREKAVDFILTSILPHLDSDEVREKCFDILRGNDEFFPITADIEH